VRQSRRLLTPSPSPGASFACRTRQPPEIPPPPPPPPPPYHSPCASCFRADTGISASCCAPHGA
jgi:hypothetical protein